MTSSSAPFGHEVQKFYNTEEENQNNTIVYFNCSAHCDSSDRSCDFRSQGFQFDISLRIPEKKNRTHHAKIRYRGSEKMEV